MSCASYIDRARRWKTVKDTPTRETLKQEQKDILRSEDYHLVNLITSGEDGAVSVLSAESKALPEAWWRKWSLPMGLGPPGHHDVDRYSPVVQVLTATITPSQTNPRTPLDLV